MGKIIKLNTKMAVYFLSILALTLGIAACGGSSHKGGHGSGAPGYTHNQLAALLVEELNATGVYDVTIAKSSTLRSNFIVVYDHDYDSYDAINIDGFRPGMDALEYVRANSSRFFYDLDVLPGTYEYVYGWYFDMWCNCYQYEWRYVWVPTRYRDRASGFVFEKLNGESKDLETFAALAEEAVISSRAEGVATKFGLSVERGREVVRLAMAWQKAGGKDLSEKDQNAFSKELLGFSITEAKTAAAAVEAGDKKALDSLVEEAALVNGTTPEHVRQIIDAYFIQ